MVESIKLLHITVTLPWLTETLEKNRAIAHSTSNIFAYNDKSKCLNVKKGLFYNFLEFKMNVHPGFFQIAESAGQFPSYPCYILLKRKCTHVFVIFSFHDTQKSCCMIQYWNLMIKQGISVCLSACLSFFLSFSLWFTYLENRSSDLLHTWQVCCWRPRKCDVEFV